MCRRFDSCRGHHLRCYLGIRLALDNFGTGYASLDGVQGLPLDFLKLPRSFVDRADGGGERAALVAATVDLAQACGITAIAVGIERETQVEALRAMCCTLGQGYLFAPPSPGLTTTALSTDRVLGLTAGVDDYVKPFDSHELVTRTKALLQRHNEKVAEGTDTIESPGS